MTLLPWVNKYATVISLLVKFQLCPIVTKINHYLIHCMDTVVKILPKNNPIICVIFSSAINSKHWYNILSVQNFERNVLDNEANYSKHKYLLCEARMNDKDSFESHPSNTEKNLHRRRNISVKKHMIHSAIYSHRNHFINFFLINIWNSSFDRP